MSKTSVAAGARSDSPQRAAAADVAPFALALIPFGVAVGSASAAAGLSATTAAFGAVVLLAGTAQLAAVDLLGTGGGVASVVVIVGLVNLRFVLYGAGVAKWFEHAPRWKRVLLAFPIVDHTFLLCQQRFDREGHRDLTWRQWYYLTVTAILAGAFVGSQVIAYQLGSNLPAGLGLHLAAPLAFAGMLATSMRALGDYVAGLVAAVVLVIGAAVLGPVGLPIGVVAGVIAGNVAAKTNTDSSTGAKGEMTP